MKKIFRILVICLFISGNTTLNAQWKTLDPDGAPEKRHECAFVEANGKYYLVGGRGMKPVNEYDPASNSWQTLSTPPIEMHHFQALAYDQKIYVIGALTGGYPDETPIPNVYIFDPRLDQWTIGPAIPEKRRRGAAGVVENNGFIYLVCGIVDGHNGGFVPWLDRWNPETNQWEVLPDAPRPRDHFQAAIRDDKIFAAGGRTTSASTGETMTLTISEVDYYDLSSGQWHTLQKDIPTERAGTSSVFFNDQLIIIGGESGAQKAAHSEVEAYNIHNKQWQKLSFLNQGRHGTQAILDDGKIYIAAGSGNRGGGPELTSLEVIHLE